MSDGVPIMATLRCLATDALRLDGYWSIAEDLDAQAHDIRGLWHCWAGENRLSCVVPPGCSADKGV